MAGFISRDYLARPDAVVGLESFVFFRIDELRRNMGLTQSHTNRSSSAYIMWTTDSEFNCAMRVWQCCDLRPGSCFFT
jgi:hypothetical protein